MKTRSGGFIVRGLRKSEIPAMLSVWKTAGLPFKPRGRDRLQNLRALFERDPELFLGAFSEGKMVGVALASDDGRRAWINRLAVVPEARRSGVALALIDRAERVMRKRGRRLFCVNIEDDNETSVSLFKRAGYHLEHEISYFTKRELKSY